MDTNVQPIFMIGSLTFTETVRLLDQILVVPFKLDVTYLSAKLVFKFHNV